MEGGGLKKALYNVESSSSAERAFVTMENLCVLKLPVCFTCCASPVLQTLRYRRVNSEFLFDFAFDYHALHCVAQSPQ